MGLPLLEKLASIPKLYHCANRVSDTAVCGYLFRLTPPYSGVRIFDLACPLCGRQYKFSVSAHATGPASLQPGRAPVAVERCRHVTLKPVGGGKFKCIGCGEVQ